MGRFFGTRSICNVLKVIRGREFSPVVSVGDMPVARPPLPALLRELVGCLLAFVSYLQQVGWGFRSRSLTENRAASRTMSLKRKQGIRPGLAKRPIRTAGSTWDAEAR